MMTNNTNGKQSQISEFHKQWIKSIFAVIGLILVLVVLIIKSADNPKNKRLQITNPATVNNDFDEKKGKMSLRKQNDRNIVAETEEFDLILSADSKKIPVGGYDAVIKYNPKIVAFVSTKGMNNDLDTVATSKNNEVIVTGSIKENKKSVILNNSTLAILTFKAIKTGNPELILVIRDKDNVSDSNIIQLNGSDILRDVESTDVLVGQKVAISSPIGKEIKSGDFLFTLNGVQLPPAGCADCTTSVDIQVKKGVQSDRLQFTTGGIAGSIHSAVESMDYLFEVGQLNSNSVEIYYAEQI